MLKNSKLVETVCISKDRECNKYMHVIFEKAVAVLSSGVNMRPLHSDVCHYLSAFARISAPTKRPTLVHTKD